MSKCPFGVKVVSAVTPIARRLGPNLKLNLEYIGRAQNGELTSMHGDTEVQGDKLQLCAHRHGAYTQWLDFLDCQNENWRQIPENWERCAERSNLDVQTLRACSQGLEGTQLLRASFEASQRAEARGSPTIFLNGEQYQGGRSEQAFSRAICAQYTERQPPSCAELSPPPEIPVTLLADRR